MHPEEEEAFRHGEKNDQIEGVLAAELDGFAADHALQFPRGDERPGGGQRAQHHQKAQRALRDDAHLRAVDEKLGNADQGGGQGAKACDKAVRCGMAVMGTQIAISRPRSSRSPGRR